jgi:hypothetical protein
VSSAAQSVGSIRGKRKIPRAPSALEERLWFLLLGDVYPDRDGKPLHYPRPVREFVFHPERKWRFDFAWPDRKIAAECEGGTWARGRHNRGSGFAADCEKYNAAAILGWRVLRFTKDMIDRGDAMDAIRDAIA